MKRRTCSILAFLLVMMLFGSLFSASAESETPPEEAQSLHDTDCLHVPPAYLTTKGGSYGEHDPNYYWQDHQIYSEDFGSAHDHISRCPCGFWYFNPHVWEYVSGTVRCSDCHRIQ